MFKKLNDWLNEHAPIWPWEGKDGVVHLWAMFLTPIIMFVMFFIFPEITIPFQILFGSVSVLPPIIAGIKALITKTKWNPWYWFPILTGSVIGGLFGCFIYWAFF